MERFRGCIRAVHTSLRLLAVLLVFASALVQHKRQPLGLDQEIPHKMPRGRVAERARELIRQIGEAREVVIIRGRSSRRLQNEFEELRKRYGERRPLT